MPARDRRILAPLLVLVAGIGACATGSSQVARSLDSVAADTLLVRYECERGPIMSPERTCFGPAFSLYADGTVIYRDVTDRQEGAPDPGFTISRLGPETVAAIYEPIAERLRPVLAITPSPVPANPGPHADPYWYDVIVVFLDDEPVAIAPGQGPIPPSGIRVDISDLVHQFESFHPADMAMDAPRPYVPVRYCAWLAESGGDVDGSWPWAEIGVDDFETRVDGVPHNARELSAADVEEIDQPVGAAATFTFTGEDGSGVYSLRMRVLMPDESCPPVLR